MRLAASYGRLRLELANRSFLLALDLFEMQFLTALFRLFDSLAFEDCGWTSVERRLSRQVKLVFVELVCHFLNKEVRPVLLCFISLSLLLELLELVQLSADVVQIEI